jgi:hypothetical protein
MVGNQTNGPKRGAVAYIGTRADHCTRSTTDLEPRMRLEMKFVAMSAVCFEIAG